MTRADFHQALCDLTFARDGMEAEQIKSYILAAFDSLTAENDNQHFTITLLQDQLREALKA